MLTVKLLQATQKNYNFKVGKLSIQEMANFAGEIFDSNLETGRYGPESGVSWIFWES